MLNKPLFLALICCLVTGCNQKNDKKVEDVDFDSSMGKGSPVWQEMCNHKGNRERLQLLRSAYDSVKPSKAIASHEAKIPKIIHQIWVGPKPIPSYFWKYKKTWKEKHPEWRYRLWTDKEVAKLDFELKDLYLASTNWGEKSDILRAELLDQFGGLYVDIDFENFKAFDDLHMKYDFYAGLEPPHQGDMSLPAPYLVVSDALVGACPGHPIIKKWKELIRAKWTYWENLYPDGPKRILLRTFFPFGEAVALHIGDSEHVNIVFPPTYFFPLTFSRVSKGKIKKFNIFKRTALSLSNLLNSETKLPFAELQPETMAVHYWGNSWVKGTDERFREMHRGIVDLQAQVDDLRCQIQELRKKEET